MHPGTATLLVVWGTITGLDLVTGPQGLLARPLVAGTVTGLLLGDLLTGIQVGAVLELFALDVLPVGASRYPDYGPATVSGVALAVGFGGGLGPLGMAAAVALLLASAGGWTMERLRVGNAGLVRLAGDQLDAGIPGTTGRLQWLGGLRDATRSAMVTLAGLGLCALAVDRLTPTLFPDALGLVLVAGGAYAATAGALRRAVRGRGRFWFAAGLSVGTLALVLIP